MKGKTRKPTKPAMSEHEALARQIVTGLIQLGMMTHEMKEAAGQLVIQFRDFMIRDIDAYARTGKLPQDAANDDAQALDDSARKGVTPQ